MQLWQLKMECWLYCLGAVDSLSGVAIEKNTFLLILSLMRDGRENSYEFGHMTLIPM